MKRLLLALPLFALTAAAMPSVAEAGLGFTAYPFGGEFAKSGALYTSIFGSVPSIDWKDGGNYVQVHLFELIDGLALGKVDLPDGSDASLAQLRLGVNYYKKSGKSKTITDRVDGVVFYGGSLDVVKNLDSDNDYLTFAPAFACRAGAQVSGGMGIGIYVVPTIGIAYTDLDGGGDAIDAEFKPYGGGTLQVSVWTK